MILFVLQYKILFQNKTVLITVGLSVKDYTFTFHICIAPQQKFS